MKILNNFSKEDGIFIISDTPFYYNEDEYDTQYGYGLIDENITRGVSDLVTHNDINRASPCLEIGCGTGVLTTSILMSGLFQHYLITDMSSAFIALLMKKIENLDINASYDFCSMKAEEINVFPDNSFSAIIMRYALHHINDWEDFICLCRNKLVEGGGIIFEEPFSNGFIIQAFAIQFFPLLARIAGEPLDDNDMFHVNHLKNIVEYYHNQSISKIEYEDKHLFQSENIMEVAQKAGLKFRFYPNVGFPEINHANTKECGDRFLDLFLINCEKNLSFPKLLVDKMEKLLSPYTEYLECIEKQLPVIYSRGVFVLKKES